MTNFDEQGRPEPPLVANEFETLVGFLEYQRATFAWKCAGVDASGLAKTIAASSMTLGGMLKHLALVEDYWFAQRLRAREGEPAWVSANWDADPDWDWHSALENTPEQLHDFWQASVAHSRVLVTEAMSEGGLDQLAKKTWPDGRSPSLRWILCHMIEEYARHVGHADLIRESIDGLTGE